MVRRAATTLVLGMLASGAAHRRSTIRACSNRNGRSSKGRLARRKNYKDGKLVLEEEYFEDGSRKSVRKTD